MATSEHRKLSPSTMSATSVSLDKGLPSNLEAERLVLGSIMLNDSLYIQAAGTLDPDDFTLEKHRLIFKRMGELHERSESIDRVTVANELHALQRARSLRRLELPGFARRRPAADPQPRQLYPHRQGQSRPAAHHLHRPAVDEPLPGGRGGSAGDSGGRRGDAAQAGRRARDRRPCQPAPDPRSLRGRHQRLPRPQQAAARASAPDSTSWTR